MSNDLYQVLIAGAFDDAHEKIPASRCMHEHAKQFGNRSIRRDEQVERTTAKCRCLQVKHSLDGITIMRLERTYRASGADENGRLHGARETVNCFNQIACSLDMPGRCECQRA